VLCQKGLDVEQEVFVLHQDYYGEELRVAAGLQVTQPEGVAQDVTPGRVPEEHKLAVLAGIRAIAETENRRLLDQIGHLWQDRYLGAHEGGPALRVPAVNRTVVPAHRVVAGGTGLLGLLLLVQGQVLQLGVPQRLGAEDGAGTVRLAEVAQRYHGVHHGWISSTISQGLCYCLFY